MHKVFQYLVFMLFLLAIMTVTIGSPVLLPQALAISPLWWISVVRVL